jgi:trigger factor
VKSSIKKLPQSKIEIFVELSKEEFDRFYREALFELSKDFKFPGFRKGKAPMELIEKSIDQKIVLDKAARKAIEEIYLKIISKEKIEVLGRAEVEILKLIPGDSFEFKISASVFPQIKLADYKRIASEKEKRKISVSEEEVEETLVFLQRSRAKFFQKDSPAQRGDFVEIEYSSPQIDGGRKIKDGFFLGKGGFVSGFEENLEGMKKGEEKIFSLKIPEDFFQKSLAGKKIDFKVKIVSIQGVKIPQLNDDFAKSLGKFKDLSDLKRSIFEGIQMEKEKAESERIQEEILNEIIENSDFEIPEILIEEEKKRYLEELKIQVPKVFNLSFEEYLKKIQKTEKEIKDSYHQKAIKEIKRALVIQEIKKREGIKASEEEILEEANKILLNFTPEEAKKIDPNFLKEYTKERIEEKKVLSFLENQTK